MESFLSSVAIDVAALRRVLDRDDCGALVEFEGRVRDHHAGRAVLRLEYECYAAMAEREGGKILQEAKERFAIEEIVACHRVGMLEIGEAAVYVGVASAHRGAAFDACRWAIDEIKARVPIWKHEHYADGTSAWVSCAQAHGTEP